MLDDLFLGEIDLMPSSANDNTKLNCASYLHKPEAPRGEAGFVGLFNQ